MDVNDRTQGAPETRSGWKSLPFIVRLAIWVVAIPTAIGGTITFLMATGLLVTVVNATSPSSASITPIEPELKVCFAPALPGGCDPTTIIVQELSVAHHQILLQAYEFTSEPIAQALVDAHQRGVDVRAILDRSNEHEGYSEEKFLEQKGVPVMIDAAHNIAHNKIIVIDGEIVITGSFNFTKAAEERNAENLVIIHDAAIAETYARNWNYH
jgi:phosphatidylserine/phosphatidylglycerophosphate/cardiolipin synthase-like enzyme